MSKEEFLKSQLDKAIQIAEGRRVDLEGRQAIIDALTAKLAAADALERLLLDLTPGGSEFHGSPECCAKWIRDRLSSTGKLAAERNQLCARLDVADALAEIGDKTENALMALLDDLQAENFAYVTFGEYREGAICGDMTLGTARAALRELSTALHQYRETTK